MQIVVKNSKKSPTLMTLEVKSSNTINELKSQISDNLHVPVDQLRLVYCSKQLSDKLTARDYNIHEDAIIYVVFRICGGIQNFVNNSIWEMLNSKGLTWNKNLISSDFEDHITPKSWAFTLPCTQIC
jgi:transcription initiation factor TFIID subunit TAF12